MVVPYQRFPSDENWKELEEFPGYWVSDAGLILNAASGRIVIRTLNGRGILCVTLTKNRQHYFRAVAPMVADAFLPLPTLQFHRDNFTTPIHLDGDRANVHVRNLMWRPRWFAIDYHKQFRGDLRRYSHPVDERETGEHFESVVDAARRFGLLIRDVDMASRTRQSVWPTAQLFRECVHTM